MTKRILAAALALASTGAFAQTFASLNDTTTGYTQSFDGLSTTTTNATTTPATIPAGFFLSNVTGAATVITADAGASTTGGYHSYGAAGSTDRALGTLGSANATNGSPLSTGIRIRNNTGTAISSFFFEFVLEQWRNQSTGTQSGIPEGLTISYRLVDPTETDATFQANLRTDALWSTEKLSTQYFNGPDGFANNGTSTNGVQTGAAGSFIPSPIGPVATPLALDGNAAANQRKVESYILLGQNNSTAGGTGFQSLLAGGDIAIRITDLDSSNGDAGNGIDNFRAVPEPATMAAMALGLGALAARRKRKSA